MGLVKIVCVAGIDECLTDESAQETSMKCNPYSRPYDFFKMTENQTETILQAIRQTQKLRASVASVFRNLADGCAVTKGNEKVILNEFHESLLNVNSDVG